MIVFLKMLGLGIGLLIASSIVLAVWIAIVAGIIAATHLNYLKELEKLYIRQLVKGEQNEQ